MKKKETTPIHEAASQASSNESSGSVDSKTGNDAAAQRLRALDMLRTGPKSTLQLRREGDILAPAARILELKRRGYEILTQWVQQATDNGKLHRVALYVLLGESRGQA